MTDDDGDLGDFDPDGAIDSDFDDAVELGLDDDVQTEPMVGGVALDLVTRQTLFICGVAADTVREHYQQSEGDFDLLSYKMHPYLPVREDDTVFECVFVPGAEKAHKPGKTYDYPRGRLMHLPVEKAWGDELDP